MKKAFWIEDQPIGKDRIFCSSFSFSKWEEKMVEEKNDDEKKENNDWVRFSVDHP